MKSFIYCSFLKQGEPILEKRVPLDKVGTLSVGKKLTDTFKLDIKESLTLGKAVSKNQFSLKKISNSFLNNEKNYAFISSTEKQVDNTLVLSKDDFVCLKYEDIDILLKIKDLTPLELQKEKQEKKERKKLKLHFYLGSYHRNFKFLAISFVLTTIILVSTLVAISSSRTISSVRDLDSYKILSLIHPDSFYLLPELVQDKLNRLSLIQNTLDTYIDYGRMFLNIEEDNNSGNSSGNYVFSNSKKRYHDLYENQSV